MSRLAKKPIVIPEKVEVAVNSGIVTVKGPVGTLSRLVPAVVSLAVADGGVVATLRNDAPEGKALLGTTVAHVRNMIQGSREHFVKKLIVEGIGFKADVKPARPDARLNDTVGQDSGRSGGGAEMVLSLGFSHQVKLPIPKDLKVVSEKGVVAISGADIEAVGAFAAKIRSLKRPEPYKGKGIRYDGEVIRRKQGKKTT